MGGVGERKRSEDPLEGKEIVDDGVEELVKQSSLRHVLY